MVRDLNGLLRKEIKEADNDRGISKNWFKIQSALKREHPALKNMKLLNFFQFLWVIFALLVADPDPYSESGSVSTDPIVSVSNPDPEPKHWY
jgi:hypothetical protein